MLSMDPCVSQSVVCQIVILLHLSYDIIAEH